MTELVDVHEEFSGPAVVPSMCLEIVSYLLACVLDMLMLLSFFWSTFQIAGHPQEVTKVG